MLSWLFARGESARAALTRPCCGVGWFQVSLVSSFTGVTSPFRIHSSASVHSKAPNCFRLCLNVSWMACSHFNEVTVRPRFLLYFSPARVRHVPSRFPAVLINCANRANSGHSSVMSLNLLTRGSKFVSWVTDRTALLIHDFSMSQFMMWPDSVFISLFSTVMVYRLVSV